MSELGTHHLESFIQKYVVDSKLQFNSTASSGAHVPLIVAAAKRRGLQVEGTQGAYIFTGGGQVLGGTRRMATSLISQVAVQVCSSKSATKLHLNLANVPTPAGVEFTPTNQTEALAFLRLASGPFVVKPDSSRGGSGVTVNVTSQTFSAASAHAGAYSRDAKLLVEKMHSGIDIRAYTVGGRVVAAVSRVPPFVIGDGTSNLATLIEAKRALRRSSVYLSRTGDIKIDPTMMASQGLQTSAIPQDGQVILLGAVANIHQGAETVDVTNVLSEDIVTIAERAAQSIPGFGAGGIDLIVTSPTDAKNAAVLEVEAGANISVHHLPAYGQPRDVAEEIVEQMIRTGFDVTRHNFQR